MEARVEGQRFAPIRWVGAAYTYTPFFDLTYSRSRSRCWAPGSGADALVGKWTEEEQSLLIECIKDVNTALGHDPLSAEAPWEIVCEKMGRTRSTTQCRKKWCVSERSERSERNERGRVAGWRVSLCSGQALPSASTQFAPLLTLPRRHDQLRATAIKRAEDAKSGSKKRDGKARTKRRKRDESVESEEE
jgi:hypothetical protein